MLKIVRRKSRGQAIIEFTLLIPLILIIVGGLTDLALAFLVSTAVQNAVREGARIQATGAATTDVATAVEDRIPDVSPFFDKSAVTVTVGTPSSLTTCNGDEQRTVTVSATGPYNFVFLRLLGFDQFQISRATTMRFEGDPLCT